MGRPALPHVVLGMDLEPADIRRGFEDGTVVLGLQPDAGAGRQGMLRPIEMVPGHVLAIPVRDVVI